MPGNKEKSKFHYVPLQVYSSAAVLDGIHAASSATALVSRAKELQLPAIALTNSNFIDLGEFMTQGEKQKVHTVPGATFQVSVHGSKNLERVTVLAENRSGLEFLFHLMTMTLLDKKILTPDTFSNRKPGEDILVYWHDSTQIVDDNLFDDTNFYAIQEPTVGAGKNVLKTHASRQEKLVVMPPVTMATPKDLLVKEFLTATRKPTRLLTPPQGRTHLNETLKSAFEMGILFPNLEGALERSAEHAELSNVQLPKKPETKAKIAGEKDSEEFLSDLVLGMLQEYLDHGVDAPQLVERVKKELQFIKALGFSDYILMSYEIARFCQENQIEFMVSGSANNSVVLWLSGVVKIDPQSSLFERFINLERGESLPDVDFLLAQSDVAKVMNFISRRYAPEVVRLCKINHLGKSSIIELAEKANFPLDAEKLAQLAAAKIPTTISTHASGLGLDAVAPLLRTGGGIEVSHWDAKAIEKFRHAYKFDVLSSQALTQIKNTIRLLREHGIPTDIPEDDPEVFAELFTGNTTALVYGDTPHLKQTLRDVGSVWEEKSLQTVAQALALARLEYGAREMYLNNHFQEHPFAAFPEIKAILERTRYVAIYQEQLMEIATLVMGQSWAEAEALRKMMSENVSWQDKEVILERVAEALEQRNYPPAVTELLKQQLLYFNSYSFVEYHSLALSKLLYVQAYFAKEYPAYFWAGAFSESIKPNDGTQEFINEMLRRGVEFAFTAQIPEQTSVDNTGKVIPGAAFFKKGKEDWRTAYGQFQELLKTAEDPKTLIKFQQEHFPAVLTHNPVEAFSKQFVFHPGMTRQTIIGNVTMMRRVGKMLYVTVDGDVQINAVVSTESLNEAGYRFSQALHMNSFHKLEIGASANRDDQWVILDVLPLSQN